MSWEGGGGGGGGRERQERCSCGVVSLRHEGGQSVLQAVSFLSLALFLVQYIDFKSNKTTTSRFE